MKSLALRIRKYLIYLLKSKSAHGIHSPFVYNLIENIIYNKSSYYAYVPLEQLRNAYLCNNEILEIKDYGAGSVYGKSKKRNVASIARHSLKSRKYAQLIFRLAADNKPKKILELGTSLGITTLYFSYACSKSQIVTVEGSDAIADIAEKAFRQFKRKNINLIKGKFADVLPQLLKEQQTFDFVFIDGHHDEEATLNYFNQILNNVSTESVVLIDDINWSQGMINAWRKIKSHEKVTLSIDVFEMGWVYFFARNQKEHFVIRF